MRFVILFVVLCLAPCAQAQKLYRCGNQYQDRPCDAGLQSKQISGAANGAAKLPPAFTELSCAQRGEAAEGIAKRLMQGQNSEQLLQEIDRKYATAESKLAEKRLVVDVAQREGSPAEIRVLTESDCVTAKKTPIAPAAQQEAAASTDGYREQEIAMQRQREERAAVEKRKRCDEYARDLSNIHSMERRGGSAKHMDQLREEFRDLEAKRKADGCS